MMIFKTKTKKNTLPKYINIMNERYTLVTLPDKTLIGVKREMGFDGERETAYALKFNEKGELVRYKRISFFMIEDAEGRGWSKQYKMFTWNEEIITPIYYSELKRQLELIEFEGVMKFRIDYYAM